MLYYLWFAILKEDTLDKFFANEFKCQKKIISGCAKIIYWDSAKIIKKQNMIVSFHKVSR